MDKRYLEAEVKTWDDPKWAHGSFEATLSMPSIDRDHEIIDANAFEPLPKSIPIFADHVATVATLVGRAVPHYDGAVLKATGRFASDDYSQMVRQKLRDGIADSMSVGYMAPQYDTDKDTGINHVVKGELLEASFVPIPSLREATVSMAKGWTNDLLEAAQLETKGPTLTHAVKDKHIQAAHDAMVKAGAICDPETLEPTDPANNAFDGAIFARNLEIEAMLVEIG